MTLPLMNQEIRYDVTLPISGKKITVRPWLVKEEKILLTAMEQKDVSAIATATKAVLRNCTFDYPVETLPLIDIEYLMLKLKMYSAGEIVTVHIKCHNTVTLPTIDPDTGEATGERETRKCEKITDVDIDLEKELTIDTSKMLPNKIQMTDTIGVCLRPPVFDLFENIVNSRSSTADTSFEILASCIDYIWYGDEVIKDFTGDEAQEWIGNLTKKQIKKIKEYIESIPKLEIVRSFECPQCKYKQDIRLKNFFDFFID